MRQDRNTTVPGLTRGAWRPDPSALVGALIVLLALAQGAPVLADGATDSGMGSGRSTFTGQVESLPSSGLIGDWKVSGKTVHVTGETVIDQRQGNVEVGSNVSVEGSRQADGSVNAKRIEVRGTAGPPSGRRIEFRGVVRSLPASGLIGDWKVGDLTVHVDASTAIDQRHGDVAVGVTVAVEGTLSSDGSVNASSIVVKPAPQGPKHTIALCGLIESLPASGLIGDWKVSGVTVHVDASTSIDETRGKAELTVSVRVRGEVQADLSINATQIVVKDATCGGFKMPASIKISVLHLDSTADAPEDAEGVVLTRMLTFTDGSSRKDLKVAVEHLQPNTSYDVMIDSFNAGPIMTDEHGEGRLFLSTADTPGAEPLPSELSDFDTLKQVDVAAAGGVVMLTGLFADARTTDHEHPGFDYMAVALLRDASSKVLGMAAAAIKADEQELALSVLGLKPGATYTLVIDTVSVDSFTASARGRIEAEYSSTPNGHELALPGALDPVSGLMHVELQDSAGAAVVSGDFQVVDKPEVTILKRLLGKRLRR